ncbi:DNA helicase-2/ATP-dependent DNA helicase PcrA [Clostridium acetobutylicum]|uniref:Superfamily I DNA and RNA helicase n=1 Tax=Clostridium acetobutylicum (strain ATCC 824 / DSM 792 / JCM 1419 / IAM 19013 / LMG 5710 / NBRC 13948 / NRRL B-527 / VKM B-1787 / 2291 / W) TaxID=272562 RepID=Q97LF8_CLOAB|nr:MULTISPECIES: UvrD-helicase domain-containing protein [Clostridium]AAK78581.1 Superfamily I DNA and RNA helicase [Clostridium acetobutylicum ATCC 824]ADZ19655.1 Superfamily I DNA and RNA helicase [Clostridium acetobutylicum EA 2018]AEI34340.1 superfamily I DNA/RNA helicase [Clostridium acetobutylicum DSM 1731]AWV80305.1 ATP-dependent DNA helicase [Clostridium acetobutylicum]MBC2392490.1 AAA family ATPase [Clostridium acetobutylicum]
MERDERNTDGEVNRLIEEKNKAEELESEALKLKGVIEIINREIIQYINKKKEISQYIIEEREKTLEDYADDEDKIIEYFDHERYVKEETFSIIYKRLKELNILLSSPYFGKIDFEEEGLGEEKIYIGRFGVTPSGGYEPLVVDWRAPIASLFYTPELGQTRYKAPAGDVTVNVKGKRQYIIKKGKLEGFFDSEVDVKDEILQMVLSKNTGDKLRDIVMTIQSEQDNIIRQERNKISVVNGVAGSGKTTIALHRVAFLLYNYRTILQDKILILGPNPVFMEYIKNVLPSLGEENVRQETFVDFALDILPLDTYDIMSTRDYMEKILMEDEEFIQDVKRKTSDNYITALDNLVSEIERQYKDNMQDVFYGDIRAVSRGEIVELFTEYYEYMPLFRRNKKIRRIIFSKLKDIRDEKIRQIQKEYEEAVKNSTSEELNLQGNKLMFQRKLKIRETLRRLMEAKRSLTWLDNIDVLEIYKRLNGDKIYTIDDVAPLMYIKIRLDGVKLEREVKHVVIDEAQDYSKLQFIVIKKLTNCLGMTIVGDSNQRLIPKFDEKIAMERMDTIFEDMDFEMFKLDKSYRSTKEIMEYANRFLNDTSIIPMVRSGEKVQSLSISSEDEFVDRVTYAIDDMKKEGIETIGVICENMHDTKYFGELLKSKKYINIIEKENQIYTGGETVMPSYFAKGLEFDGVILVSRENKENKDRVLYVMATRALHKLYDFHIEF